MTLGKSIQISSKSIPKILSFTVTKFARFFETQCILLVAQICIKSGICIYREMWLIYYVKIVSGRPGVRSSLSVDSTGAVW